MLVDNLLTFGKPSLSAMYYPLSLLEVIFEYISFVGELVDSVFGADVALLGSDNGTEPLIRVFSYLSRERFGVESGELFEGIDRGITLTAEGISNNFINV